jgi:hypothetical protein
MDRRDLFKILAVAGACRSGEAAVGDNYNPRFFTPAEYDAVDMLTDLLIPADDEGPGAREAGVARYIDTVLLYADEKTKARWKVSLASIEGRKDFPAVMAEMASGENDPASESGRFLVLLKSLAIPAFALSEAGMRYLGYRGDRELHEFPGCTHPGHQA